MKRGNHNFKNTWCIRFACLCLACLIGVSSLSGAKKRASVMVDSFALDAYLEQKEGDGDLKLETYHFFKGKHFGGNIRDSSIRQVPFQEVVDSLAKEMKARRFYPSSDKEKGDFLVVVHWGVTGIEESFDELFQNEPGSGDQDSGFDDELDSGATFESSGPDDFQSLDYGEATNSRKDNAALTGFDRALNRRGLMPQDEYELKSMLQDERYFIVLMAYDYQHLRAGEGFKLIWSTRFSLDAIGTNFEDAHFALSRGAANYFGTNLEGKLKTTRTHLGTGDVDIGGLEVIETVEEEKAAPKK